MTKNVTKKEGLLFNAGEKGLPLCPNDEFPIIEINGQMVCIAEVLDYCAGQQKVTKAIKKGREINLVFERGHRIPLLCWCCNSPLHFEDFKGFRKFVSGRYLDSFGYKVNAFDEDGRFGYELELRLVKPSNPDDYYDIGVAFQSIVNMVHPRSCAVAKGTLPAAPSRFVSVEPDYRANQAGKIRLPQLIQQEVEKLIKDDNVLRAADLITTLTNRSPHDVFNYIDQLKHKLEK